MAQFDIILQQNTAAAGVEFSEKYINIAKGGLVTALADGTPTVLAGGANTYTLIRDDAEVTGLKWVAVTGGHTQNTDTGTTNGSFALDSDGTTNGVLLKTSSGVLQLRNLTDNAYADLIVKDLTVEGTTTTVNSTTVTVDDKNIELGSVAVPTDTTADGGGITLRGATDKTILWDNANDNWTLNQNVNIPTGTTFKINNTTVLSATQVLGVTLGTMASATATDYVLKSIYDANSIIYATADNTPLALTVGASTFVGRKAAGDISAMTPAEAMNVLWVTAPAAKTSTGVAGQIAKDANFYYICTATDTWKRSALATNWV